MWECSQVRQAKKAEVQAQKKAEKAAREAAEREKDMRSYKHIMQVRGWGVPCVVSCLCSRPGLHTCAGLSL